MNGEHDGTPAPVMLRTSVATQSGDWLMLHSVISLTYSSSVCPGQCWLVLGADAQPWWQQRRVCGDASYHFTPAPKETKSKPGRRS
jgi:hypothetical protein